ncbi:sensor histidine kinase [Streptacidiphilus monticola]
MVSGPQIAEVAKLGDERVRQGLHLTHSIRAGMILLDLVMDAISEAVGLSEDGDGHSAAVRSLQQGVSRRLEIGSVGYDTLLLTRVRALHEEGRRKLAREIHDQLGNSLSLAMRQLEMYELVHQRAGTEAGPQVRAVKAAVLEALDTSRQLVTELRRSNVSGTLETALRGFVSSMGDTGSSVQIWVQGSDEWLPGRLAEELFVLVRECLRNALRHSRADNVVVSIDIAPHQVQTEVIDDGQGFDLDRVRTLGSNGLDGMAERVQLLRGTLNIGSTPGHGTRVMIWFPIEEEHEDDRLRG